MSRGSESIRSSHDPRRSLTRSLKTFAAVQFILTQLTHPGYPRMPLAIKTIAGVIWTQQYIEFPSPYNYTQRILKITIQWISAITM